MTMSGWRDSARCFRRRSIEAGRGRPVAMTRRFLPALFGAAPSAAEPAARARIEEEHGVRCLRFDGSAVQSAMRVAEPYALDLAYTRAMMAFLLFDPEPRHILAIGLGGGSVPKFCHRELPQARVTAVEIDPEVIALRDRFLIPPDGLRFRVVQADGSEYLARDGVAADIIVADGYDWHGLPDRLCSPAFYADCRRALGAPGVLVVNLWGSEPNRALHLERLGEIFSGRVWWSRPRNSCNLIAYAVKDERYYPQWSRLMARALALDARYRLDLARVVHDLRRRPDPDA